MILAAEFGCHNPDVVEIRRLEDSDDLVALTALLHRAYAVHAAAGLHFVASHQSPEVTRARVENGTTFVAVAGGEVVGTVTVQLQPEGLYGEYSVGPAAASFGQFAVDPRHQGGGVGRALLQRIIDFAREQGCVELLLGTAQPAKGLLAYYERQGFEVVAPADFRPLVNYESFIMRLVL